VLVLPHRHGDLGLELMILGQPPKVRGTDAGDAGGLPQPQHLRRVVQTMPRRRNPERMAAPGRATSRHDRHPADGMPPHQSPLQLHRRHTVDETDKAGSRAACPPLNPAWRISRVVPDHARMLAILRISGPALDVLDDPSRSSGNGLKVPSSQPKHLDRRDHRTSPRSPPPAAEDSAGGQREEVGARAKRNNQRAPLGVA
jgi:hypothetical protein